MAEISSLSKRILRELCMNSRVTITELSSKLDISRPIVARRIQSMERELGLYYTIELNYREAGLGEMVAYYISFSKKPSKQTIQNWLMKSNMVQLALETEGDFDLVMFVLSSNDEEFAKWNLNIGVDFSDYGVSVNKSDMDIVHLGFVPANKETLAKTKVGGVYKRLLFGLNSNSRSTVRELSKQVGMQEEMTRYYMRKLTEMRIIKRFTTVITKPAQCTNIVFFMKYTYRSGAIDRILQKRKLYFKREEDPPLFNDWQMVSSTSGSSDELEWGAAETKAQAVEDRLKLHEIIFKRDSPAIKYGIVKGVMKGMLGVRSVDIKTVYVKTEWTPGLNYTGD